MDTKEEILARWASFLPWTEAIHWDGDWGSCPVTMENCGCEKRKSVQSTSSFLKRAKLSAAKRASWAKRPEAWVPRDCWPVKGEFCCSGVGLEKWWVNCLKLSFVVVSFLTLLRSTETCCQAVEVCMSLLDPHDLVRTLHTSSRFSSFSARFIWFQCKCVFLKTFSRLLNSQLSWFLHMHVFQCYSVLTLHSYCCTPLLQTYLVLLCFQMLLTHLFFFFLRFYVCLKESYRPVLGLLKFLSKCIYEQFSTYLLVSLFDHV